MGNLALGFRFWGIKPNTIGEEYRSEGSKHFESLTSNSDIFLESVGWIYENTFDIGCLPNLSTADQTRAVLRWSLVEFLLQGRSEGFQRVSNSRISQIDESAFDFRSSLTSHSVLPTATITRLRKPIPRIFSLSLRQLNSRTNWCSWHKCQFTLNELSSLRSTSLIDRISEVNLLVSEKCGTEWEVMWAAHCFLAWRWYFIRNRCEDVPLYFACLKAAISP
jgi:hypothetical protein